MGNNIKSNTTFWTEINNYKIQVPNYQRDYAQGRTDGGRIDNIRNVFVKELYQAIKEDKQCHLGLVFGSYDENSKTFIAVDGQQRLTTVFLLHWYVAWRENKLTDYQKLSTNFSWDTRSFSSQFVELLFKINQSDNVINVINAITTNSDYFSIWENDPTVKGILTMLKEIENQYPKGEGGLCQKLFSDDCKIRYDILKLEKNSDGKTYLKMNSRGRSLTTFELFKSKFIDEYKPSFAKKFDDEWLNFMLNMSKDNNGYFADPDIPYMNFINEYTYMILSLHSNDDSNDNSDEGYKLFIDAKMKGNLMDVPFISFDEYKHAFENINSFEEFFDWICKNYEIIKGNDGELRFHDSKFFADEIIKSSNPNFSHRAKMFSLFKYAELTEYADVDKELYKRWNRVFRNLVANSEIHGNNFSKTCETINKIENVDIYSYLYKGGILDTFDKGQVAEEIEKAKKIIEHPSWESKIIEAEKYAFFKGAIRFLFQNADGDVDWDNFDTKWENAKKYFDNDGIQKDYKTNCILLRTFISKFKNWEDFWGFNYDNQIPTWKYLLTSERYLPINEILITDVEPKNNALNTFDASLKNYDDGYKELQKNVQNDLVKTNIIEVFSSENHAKLNWRYDKSKYCLYPTNAKSPQKICVIADKRNTILACCINENKIECKQQIEGSVFFWGWDIDFQYNGYFFRWLVYPRAKNPDNEDRKELDVYLMGDNWKDYKTHDPIKGTDTEKATHFCFSVTKEMEQNANLFTKQLDCLIIQAYPDADKSVCEECKEKDCAQNLEK